MARQSKKRGAGWIGCIDFGTALSKFAMAKAVDREDIAPATIRPVPVRVARPAWSAERAQAGEGLLKDLVKSGFALTEMLGPALTASGGISQRQALTALKKLNRTATGDGESSSLHLTATSRYVRPQP